MARIGSDHFADGWQEKKVSQQIRDVGKDQVKKDINSSKQMMDRLVHAKNTEAAQKSAALPQEGVKVQPPAEKQVQQSATQATRPEVQHEVAKFQTQKLQEHEQAYQKTKLDAKGLDQLTKSRQPASPEAIEAKPQPANPNLQPDTRQSSTFTLAQTMNRVPHQQGIKQAEVAAKPADPKKAAGEDQKTVKQGSEMPDAPKTTNQGTLPVQEAGKFIAQAPQIDGKDDAKGGVKKDQDGEKRISKEKRSASQSARSVGVYKSNAGNQLDRLLGGGSSSTSDGSNADAGTHGSSAVAANPIPQEDSSLKVFNEYDSARPGVEKVLEQKQILERFVIKRIKEIAAFDQALDKQIRDVFETRPLKDRIEGELKDALKSANFHKSVYGGLIG